MYTNHKQYKGIFQNDNGRYEVYGDKVEGSYASAFEAAVHYDNATRESMPGRKEYLNFPDTIFLISKPDVEMPGDAIVVEAIQDTELKVGINDDEQ